MDSNLDTSLPGCSECGGNARHLRRCSAYDPARVISSPGGWCTPSGTVVQAGALIGQTGDDAALVHHQMEV